MKITNEIVEAFGFKRINNSMWRLGDITLQNGYTSTGEHLIEKILNLQKAYKVCYFGKYLKMIHTAVELEEIKKLNQ